MDLESLAGICHGLEDCRREGLTKFVNEFMPVLFSLSLHLRGFVIRPC